MLDIIVGTGEVAGAGAAGADMAGLEVKGEVGADRGRRRRRRAEARRRGSCYAARCDLLLQAVA